jgi:hypothetical protein
LGGGREKAGKELAAGRREEKLAPSICILFERSTQVLRLWLWQWLWLQMWLRLWLRLRQVNYGQDLAATKTEGWMPPYL